MSIDLKKALSDLNPIKDFGAQPEGEIHDPRFFVGLSACTEILAKDIADALVRRYPGFLWAVQPDDNGHVINVFCLNFHDQYGYTIRVVDIQDDPGRREALKAGSELLRRFRYPSERYETALANTVPRDLQGRAIPDLSDMRASRQKSNSEVALAYATGKARTLVDANGELILELKS